MSSHNSESPVGRTSSVRCTLGRGVATAALLIAAPLTAVAVLPPWLQHVRSSSTFEAALYRLMELPGAKVFFPRPPKESVAELNKLPASTALYSLRAHEEEQALDFAAAEADWKAFAATAQGNRLQLADFYHRRLAVKPELTTLLSIAADSAPEPFVATAQQRAWQAFERALHLAAEQSLDDATTLAIYRAWLAHYAQQPTVYGRAFTWALEQRRYSDAEAILAEYRKAFPADQVFPVKAAALLALKRGNADAQARALEVYDAAFQPLWPDTLVSSYFALLDSTHNLRHFVADANAHLRRNPDDLNALGRIFLYDQHQTQGATALASLDTYRRSKEARNAAWTAVELDTLAQLSLRAGDAPAAARYDFALYSQRGTLPDGRDARSTGLASMVSLLLSTPEQPVTLGAGNLSMYRDIATLDQGPGYWNGVLSLWFNRQYPSDKFAEEEKRAQPYFQRAKAAELLSVLDRETPSAPQRAGLHAQILQTYADNGESAEVVREGAGLLAAFPGADSAFRLSVAMTMADAYARQADTKDEFALYDRTLQELGSRAQNMPLTLNAIGSPRAAANVDEIDGEPAAKKPLANQPAFDLDTGAPSPVPHPEAAAYAQVLDRYLGRLTTAHQLPEALAVLRKELDRNPNDPQIYEKLANFLGQNNLSAQQEEVYRRAMDRFQDTSWLDKLARFYLRQKRTQDFATLTRKVADTFEGTDLDAWFRKNSGAGPQLYLQLNLYAHQRFPHDIVFTDHLLNAYTSKTTADSAAWERLLRETWWQSPALTSRYFEFLSRTGKLDDELAALQAAPPSPAAQQEAAEGELWRSHFEQSAPLYTELSASYPADVAIGETASNLQRSLAWFDGSHTATSVAIEQRLLAANPGDISRLARIGDILADHADDTAASLAAAALYWRRMPATAPASRDTYLQAATVFWDYFQFDDALAEIAAARAHFHQPALYGYEAGAIAEGKRDYPLAVREYAAAATAEGGGDYESRARLLRLARRPSTHELVDTTTAGAANGGGTEALALRLNVLATLHRTAEAGPLLAAALRSARTADEVAGVAELVRSNSNNLTAIYDQALARQAELTTDPVEKLQLRYQLARTFEDRSDTTAAARIVEDIYKQNPVLLGVVRATVDFDWRSKRQREAIVVLVAAAKSSQTAQPALARQFTAEAADKANESGDTQQARALAGTLLEAEPYNAQYLSLAAGSFVRANDNSGLQRFYLARLEALKTAPMSSDERKQRTALLRKGLIPALTRGGDFEGAVAQYIALLSAYPENAALNNEAALYALSHDGKAQLVGFLTATTKASPRDSRFFIDLAQVYAMFGDLPAAVDAYAHALAIRKDRADIYTAKAALEETLQRFDDAAADYQRLYVLTYKDPQWMVAIAKLRARQGRASEAADALKRAYLTGPKKLPRDFFQVASQLEQWNLLEQAATFAEEGRTAAGPRFLAPDGVMLGSADPVTYARILMRLRRGPALFAALNDALEAASVSASSPGLITQQVQSQGIASVTESQWRRQQAAARKLEAERTYAAALTAMGAVVDTFYTPEERSDYALELTHEGAQATPKQLTDRWIPAAHAAGLLQREADWRKQLLMAASTAAGAQVQPYDELQTSRLLFAELGQTLEQFLKQPRSNDGVALVDAADAFHQAGDSEGEMRVLRSRKRDEADSSLRDRYLNLLLHHDPSALVAAAGGAGESAADAATNLALQKAAPAVALAAVKARGSRLPAISSPAMTGAAMLYFGDARGDASFRAALSPDSTIVERIASKRDGARQLSGELWFYYAARDGQLRLLTPATRPSAEDLLAADLEYASTPTSYKNLAQTYVEAGDAAAALSELDHVLELNPNDVDTHDARAVILWSANRHDEAVAAWRAGMASLRVIEDRAAAPETFWTGFRRIARHLHERALVTGLRPQIDDVLRIYVARNGNYRSAELLQAVFEAAPTQREGTEWVLSLASGAVDPGAVLESIDASEWLAPAAREMILLREVQMAQNGVHPVVPRTYDGEQQRLIAAQDSLISLYSARHEDARALALFRSARAADRDINGVLLREVVLAAHAGELDTVLKNLRSQPDTEYTMSDLKAAAKEFSSGGQWAQARAVQEFIFERALSSHTLSATDYLGLAEARLHTGDVAGAVSLLNSLTQMEGDAYANIDSAATLLEKTGQRGEALPFLVALARSVPWNLSYGVRLAEAQQSAKQSTAVVSLVALARNSLAPYALRLRAAHDLSGTAGAGDLGSGELTLIASSTVSPEAAERPFFVAARVAAAAASHEPKQRAMLIHEAIAIKPGDPSALLSLFRAERSLGDAPASRAALDALLKTPVAQDPDTVNTSILSDRSDLEYPDWGGRYDAPLPALPQQLTVEERASLALEIADTFRRDGDDKNAIAYFKHFLYLTPANPRAAEVRNSIAAIQAAQRLEAANNARRPLIHKTLDQAMVVRVRLTVAPEDAPPATKEEE